MSLRSLIAPISRLTLQSLDKRCSMGVITGYITKWLVDRIVSQAKLCVRSGLKFVRDFLRLLVTEHQFPAGLFRVAL